MRLFVGITIPLEIREMIEAYIADAEVGIENVKWVEKNNFHITLKFLGEVQEENVPPLVECLKKTAVGKVPFLISLSSVGAFPSMKYPRVYWIGVDKGKEMVKTLHDDIERVVQELGFAAEGKRFHPHVTIGRLRKFGKGSQLSGEKSCFGEFIASDFNLFKSTITKKGPIYDIIEKMEFMD